MGTSYRTKTTRHQDRFRLLIRPNKVIGVKIETDLSSKNLLEHWQNPPAENSSTFSGQPRIRTERRLSRRRRRDGSVASAARSSTSWTSLPRTACRVDNVRPRRSRRRRILWRRRRCRWVTAFGAKTVRQSGQRRVGWRFDLNLVLKMLGLIFWINSDRILVSLLFFEIVFHGP